jgi:hypothetical protein
MAIEHITCHQRALWSLLIGHIFVRWVSAVHFPNGVVRPFVALALAAECPLFPYKSRPSAATILTLVDPRVLSIAATNLPFFSPLIRLHLCFFTDIRFSFPPPFSFFL